MREGTRRWVERAEKDLEIAERLLREKFYDYACYFSQQAVEKYLKAFLVEKGVRYPRTHDIKHLIRLCMDIDGDFEYLLEIEADKLTIYSTETRYPEYEFEADEEMAREAVNIAGRVREFVLEKLSIGEK